MLAKATAEYLTEAYLHLECFGSCHRYLHVYDKVVGSSSVRDEVVNSKTFIGFDGHGEIAMATACFNIKATRFSMERASPFPAV